MKRVFMMSGVVVLTVACLFVAGCTQPVAESEEPAVTQAEPQSELEGVWELAEAYGRDAEGDWRWDPIQPGLQIFRDGYVSVTFVSGDEARPLLDEGETFATVGEEKLRAICGPLTAGGGSYEVSGSTLTMTMVVAKSPNVMQGTPITRTFRVDEDVLTLRQENEDGTWQELRWRRLR